MKKILLSINHTYLFFGTTLYVGVLWALHFFWFPGWNDMTLDVVQQHFIGPTSEATKFFTIIVPLMMLTSLVMVVTEWKTNMRWPAIIGMVCIVGATYVGTQLIIPINQSIAAGEVTSLEMLRERLGNWMAYNDIRMAFMTVMWFDLMYYFIAKGKLLDSLARLPSWKSGRLANA